jgi:hypothetical protein
MAPGRCAPSFGRASSQFFRPAQRAGASARARVGASERERERAMRYAAPLVVSIPVLWDLYMSTSQLVLSVPGSPRKQKAQVNALLSLPQGMAFP